MKIIKILVAFIAFLNSTYAQKATISEEKRNLLTYPFSDPNPSPILMGSHKNIYPYHSFDGYSLHRYYQDWKVVKLENDFIIVYVLPEVGGKVWGAIEKSTGKEFIYRNEVMKFRNISMRGPWTSGGIEFNFGIIGHSPSTASPVDYTTQENADGSVSCIVGNTDLPSRTQWRVEIRLPKDKAYFETIPMWSNPTPVPQNYYNFMTAAAVVADDLEFYYPGNQSLEHNGEAKPYPTDKDGHFIPKYANNAFGSHTSIHVVGDYNDYMGGYYHKSDFGFGHWALYDEMPGRKLWLWALSREGEIWKDLLTDADGQYMEFQAGRTFNQYAQSNFKSSIKEMPFNPGVTDRWREIWFPVKEIDGMKEVSPKGVLNVTHENGFLKLGINALAFVSSKILVKSGNKILLSEEKTFKPMDVYKKTITLAASEPYEVILDGMDLAHFSVSKTLIKRPFVNNANTNMNSASYFYQLAVEQKLNRNYVDAKTNYQKCLNKDSEYTDAKIGLAELAYRTAQYDSVLHFTRQVLQTNAYHPAANYYAGIAYSAQKDAINALESLGWAARSMEYRTAAYAEMAAIKLAANDAEMAIHYANQAINYNKFNLNALKILALANRKSGNLEFSKRYINEILALDPLNHFALFEKYLIDPTADNLLVFKSKITNEFPYQTYLELFLDYYKLGQNSDALMVLNNGPGHPILALWRAFLKKDEKELQAFLGASPAFVFPYRTETLEPLQWAITKNNHWKIKYYLGLNLWGIDRIDEAQKLFESCGNEPNFATFYASRAFLNKKNEKLAFADLQKAKELDPADWRNWSKIIGAYEQNLNHKKALELAIEAVGKFPENFNVSLQYARALINNDQYMACTEVLNNLTILPFEGSVDGKNVYELAYLNLALADIKSKKYSEALFNLAKSKEYPENLGVGAPYEPDNRMQNYLEAFCLEKSEKIKEASQKRDSILTYTQSHFEYPNFNNIWALKSLNKANNKKEVAKYIAKIKAAPNFKGSKNEWAVASYFNDINTKSKIEKSLLGNSYLKTINKAILLE